MSKFFYFRFISLLYANYHHFFPYLQMCYFIGYIDLPNSIIIKNEKI